MVCMHGGIQHENKSKMLNKPKPINAFGITRRDYRFVILRIFVLQDEYSVSPLQFLEPTIVRDGRDVKINWTYLLLDRGLLPSRTYYASFHQEQP
jgi:hypothetical protein